MTNLMRTAIGTAATEAMESFISHPSPLQLAALGAFALLTIAAAIWITGRPAFQRREIMTQNETEFFERLTSALPGSNIWPQVPIFALLEPKRIAKNGKFPNSFRLISNRRVDWVIANGAKPLLIIELDDRTHDARADRRRDRILQSCGYRVLRYQSKNRPSPATIAADVRAVLQTGS